MSYSSRSPTAPYDLPLFSDVPGLYYPAISWLDGNAPQHPFFESGLIIKRIVRGIKDRLLDLILDGIRTILLQDKSDPTDTDVAQLRRSLEEHRALWVAVVSVQKYGVVYLATRAECRDFLHINRKLPDEADMIDRFLQSNNVAVRAINFGVHQFVTQVSADWKVETADTLVPPNAISALGPNHFAVRKKDFYMAQGRVGLPGETPLYDLHDFSHLTTATLSAKLYGNKYFESLHKLNPAYRSLITSRGLKNLKGPLFSDGIIFSQFLTHLYTQEAGVPSYTYASLTTALAQKLADYLMARSSLFHPGTGTSIKLDHPIRPDELACLAQNKRYELTASEMEQRVLFRGGPRAEERDVLEGKNARQRIEYLAASRSWTYYEVRNTIKHRAMREAYGMVAKEFLESGAGMGLSIEDVEIARRVLEAVEYEDFKRGEVVDLWEVISASGRSRDDGEYVWHNGKFIWHTNGSVDELLS